MKDLHAYWITQDNEEIFAAQIERPEETVMTWQTPLTTAQSMNFYAEWQEGGKGWTAGTKMSLNSAGCQLIPS